MRKTINKAVKPKSRQQLTLLGERYGYNGERSKDDV
jgi:hypothetical protein